jgi:hypothetical protein
MQNFNNFSKFDLFRILCFFFLSVGLRFNYINLCGYVLGLGIFLNFIYFFFSKNTLLQECKTSLKNIQNSSIHYLRKYILYFLCAR